MERYLYPGSDRIFAERGIRLISGDGHIVLTTCVPGGAGQVVVNSTKFADPVCFQVTGATGSLTMSIPEVYSIKGDGHFGKATVTTGSAQTTTEIKKNSWTPINGGDGATLLKIETWS
ncbi:hypothetical protein M8C13_19305 [Crossiella sp. SN42]|uniref:hypothetical protein n=1 Tax=Crossiella sp. SN42 TaxID=2944808 RepID=UPI00207D0E36|nr:hypothetical protein [Crossiella sp. SN42]MCO1577905.1 hypothetical protein [Crossiella sp. SN42]